MDFTELPAAEQVMPAADAGILPLFSALWFVGVIFLVGHFAIRYWHILKKLDTAVLLRENIYQSEWISAPVVIGLLKPKIIVPFFVDETGMKYVIAHEKAHIRRGDHWWKLLAYGLLTLHWFNPLVWSVYMLLGRDIELACDEAVIQALDSNGRADYSQALVMCSARNASATVYLLGFGGVGVKTRVKSVLNYRKPTVSGYILTAAVMVILSACFLTDPIMEQPQDVLSDPGQLQMQETVTEPACNPTPTEPQEEALRAELEKLERSLAFYQGHLVEDRDLFVYKKVHEKADEDDLLGLRLSMAFYGRMITELEHRIGFLQKQIAAL